MDMSEALEIVRFRLKPGKEAGFAAANAEVSEWLKRQPGFVGRQLAVNGDGNWIDLVRWQSRAQAIAAADRLLGEIGDCAAMQAIDPASIDMSHAAVAVTA